MGIPSINIVCSLAQGRRLTMSLNPYLEHTQYQVPKKKFLTFPQVLDFLLLFLRFSKIELLPDLRICSSQITAPFRNAPLFLSNVPTMFLGSWATAGSPIHHKDGRWFYNLCLHLQRILGMRGWDAERSSFTLNSILMLPDIRLDILKVPPSNGWLTSFIKTNIVY